MDTILGIINIVLAVVFGIMGFVLQPTKNSINNRNVANFKNSDKNVFRNNNFGNKK